MIILVMGVSGSGKNTVGELLAEHLGFEFIDGDDYHPPENVAKMAAGTALTDADRGPWLDRLNSILKEKAHAVLACSALKAAYRERLRQGIDDFRIVYLQGSEALIGKRVAARKHRYMPASLLASQFATLEPPRDAIAVDVGGTPEEAVAEALRQLR